MDRFKKKALTLRQYLQGAEYFHALKAMDFAARHHTGTRKDGQTPEFDHQISIALYALTLPNLIWREEVLATIFLHDVREDYGITDGEIRLLFVNPDVPASAYDIHFGDRVAEAVENMTKEWRGHRKDEDALFAAMAEDPIASIAKGCDRIHNLQSMVEVFSLEKQRQYIAEVRKLFLPMLKTARREFPRQALAYENIKHVLNSQIELIEAMHRAVAPA